jgi:hypothetical protein
VAGAMVFHVAKSSSGSGALITIGTNTTTGRLMSGKTFAAGRRLDADSAQTVTGTQDPLVWSVGSAVIDYANSNLHLYENGTLNVESLSYQTSGNTSNTVSSMYRIGANANATAATFFNGDIAELILIQNDVTTATRQLVEGYLAHKYGLSASLPAGHPYKSAPPPP